MARCEHGRSPVPLHSTSAPPWAEQGRRIGVPRSVALVATPSPPTLPTPTLCRRLPANPRVQEAQRPGRAPGAQCHHAVCWGAAARCSGRLAAHAQAPLQGEGAPGCHAADPQHLACREGCARHSVPKRGRVWGRLRPSWRAATAVAVRAAHRGPRSRGSCLSWQPALHLAAQPPGSPPGPTSASTHLASPAAGTLKRQLAERDQAVSALPPQQGPLPRLVPLLRRQRPPGWRGCRCGPRSGLLARITRCACAPSHHVQVRRKEQEMQQLRTRLDRLTAELGATHDKVPHRRCRCAAMVLLADVTSRPDVRPARALCCPAVEAVESSCLPGSAHSHPSHPSLAPGASRAPARLPSWSKTFSTARESWPW